MTESMNEMRRQYHRELTANENFEYNMKKQLDERLKRQNADGDDFMDSMENSAHFFEAAENIPEDIRHLCNSKIMKVKCSFEKATKGHMKYAEALSKKVFLYESMSSEFHALIEMPI